MLRIIKRVTLLVLIFLSANSLVAQDDNQLIYSKTYLWFNNDSNLVTGAIYSLKDSTIEISNSFDPQVYQNGTFNVESYSIYTIDYIKIKKRNRLKKSIVSGAVTGLIVGGIIGAVVASKDADEYSKMVLGAGGFLGGSLIGSIYGAGIGALFGIVKIKIPIHGNKDKYYTSYKKLKKYAIVQ